MFEPQYTSVLGLQCRDALERLLFFNDNQARASEGVSAVVRRYGSPRIGVEEGRLRVGLGEHVAAQSLYVVIPTGTGIRPIGALVYTREDDKLVVLFVAVDGEYASRGPRSHTMLLSKMVGELKRLATRVRGIAALEVYLGRPTPTRIAIRRPSTP
ncbi:MAG: hypothetical protein AAF721_23090 [Myxococcota bacterium]